MWDIDLIDIWLYFISIFSSGTFFEVQFKLLIYQLFNCWHFSPPRFWRSSPSSLSSPTLCWGSWTGRAVATSSLTAALSAPLWWSSWQKMSQTGTSSLGSVWTSHTILPPKTKFTPHLETYLRKMLGIAKLEIWFIKCCKKEKDSINLKKMTKHNLLH